MRKSIVMSVFLLLIIIQPGCSNAAGVDDVLIKAKKESKVVMLELGSTGCIPCEQMKPVMQKLRDTYKGKLEVVFIDVRVDRSSGTRFGVTVIPTQVFLDNRGKEYHRHVGFYGFDEIVPVLRKQGL